MKIDMKADELMIGDWVQIVSDAPVMPNEYHRIDWIRTGEIGLDNRKIVTHPYLQAIPLTSEILEKNGKWDNDAIYFLGDGHEWLELTVRADGSVWWTINLDEYQITRLRYVHELQHALRLCKIGKEIEL